MSMVLVDTSAWIEFFRKSNSSYGAVVDGLLRENLACTTGLIKAEILPGTRSKKEYNLLRDYLAALPYLADPKDMWDRVIEGQRKLKQKGINGVGIPDLLVAVTAMAHGVAVFSKDRHFKQMEKYVGLKRFKP
jgi:predicted nucleic acid-binding protein